MKRTKYQRGQLLEIDDSIYAGDDDMMYIINRLHYAASDPTIRQKMDEEDTAFMELLGRKS